MKLSERDIERTISDYLALDGWRALKTDPVSRREWGKGFGERGMADVLMIRYEAFRWIDLKIAPPLIGYFEQHAGAQVLWIEHKRRGKKAAQHQLDWHAAERARGALTLIAGEDFEASIEGFERWYIASGLQRRKIPIAAREAS